MFTENERSTSGKVTPCQAQSDRAQIINPGTTGMTMVEAQTPSRAEIFRIFADENRLRIIEALMTQPCCVKDLVKQLKLEQSLVSHHLSVMRQFDLVKYEKQGRQTRYQLSSRFEVDHQRRRIDLGCCRIDFEEPNLEGDEIDRACKS